mmetsp:Transcript_4826/g.30663  ORF Transcript_4826/g.30663 Transcript_4826/m.30663 type:complete len:228 (+) Transcript_4826:1488-2171(+)
MLIKDPRSKERGKSTHFSIFPLPIPPPDQAKRFRCNTSTCGATSTVKRLVALDLLPHASHRYLLSPSRTSVSVNRMKAFSTDAARWMSRLMSKHGSKVFEQWEHTAHFTWLRSFPPNMQSMAVRFDSPFLMLDFRMASVRHLANSCASSCRPTRNPLESCRSPRANVVGDTVLFLACMAIPTCLSNAQRAQKAPWAAAAHLARECLPSRHHWAKEGVCVKHCSTAFM